MSKVESEVKALNIFTEEKSIDLTKDKNFELNEANCLEGVTITGYIWILRTDLWVSRKSI